MSSCSASLGRPSSLPPLTYSDVVSGGCASIGKVEISFGEVQGFPAAFISDEDMRLLAQPFALTLVGKFVFNRPPVALIRKFVLRLKFFGPVWVDQFDQRHVSFRFSDERDYIRFFAHRIFMVFGVEMSVGKWSPFHAISEVVPILPLWISFPSLRFHLFHPNTLLDIAKVFGKPLCVDSSTASQGFMSNARVLVEVDVSLSHPEKIWLGSRESGAFQNVFIENLPSFCVKCKLYGHVSGGCTFGLVESPTVGPSPPAICRVGSGGPVAPSVPLRLVHDSWCSSPQVALAPPSPCGDEVLAVSGAWEPEGTSSLPLPMVAKVDVVCNPPLLRSASSEPALGLVGPCAMGTSSDPSILLPLTGEGMEIDSNLCRVTSPLLEQVDGLPLAGGVPSVGALPGVSVECGVDSSILLANQVVEDGGPVVLDHVAGYSDFVLSPLPRITRAMAKISGIAPSEDGWSIAGRGKRRGQYARKLASYVFHPP